MKKRMLSLLLVLAMLVVSLSCGVLADEPETGGESVYEPAAGADGAAAETTEASNPFQDLALDAYYYEPVLWGYGAGIANGTTTTTFGPNDSCTRGQAITFLWRFAGSPVVSTSSKFTDVKSSDYYYKAVMWAVSKGITSGTSTTTFSPNKTLTRGEFVTFLWRYLGQPSSGSNRFSDVKSGDFFYRAVSYCYSNGIVSGTSDTTFSPYANCTRGQVMTFLYRYRKPWVELYAKALTGILNENGAYEATAHFALAYVDNDEIPELLFSEGSFYHFCSASVYAIRNGAVQLVWKGSWSFGGLSFSEKTGKVYTEDVQSGITITYAVTISHGSADVHKLTYNSGYMSMGVEDYSYDGQTVPASTYRAYYNQYIKSYTWTSFCGIDRVDGLALNSSGIQTLQQNYTKALLN